MVSFDARKDIPSLEGKVVLVTGGNIGLGKQCVLDYARHNPAQIWLACRSPDKAKDAIEEIQQQLPTPANIRVLELDLSSLTSVKSAATRFLSEASRLDILMLNAGIMGSAPGLTTDGYEVQFGVNYLGHALLAKLLHPLLEKTSKLPNTSVRALMVSSTGHKMTPAKGIQFADLKTECASLGAFERYGQSKLANVLWAKHAASLYPNIKFVSPHPGLVSTNLANSSSGASSIWKVALTIAPWFAQTPEKGARNQLWASVGDGVKSGEYYEPIGVSGRTSALGKDEELAKRLWEWTERELESWVV